MSFQNQHGITARVLRLVREIFFESSSVNRRRWIGLWVIRESHNDVASTDEA